MREQTAIKLKTAGIIVGVTAVVYVLIKYMLPLVAPFAFAFIIACIIDKPVGFMYERFGLKRIIGATVMTVLLTAILGLVMFYGARTLLGQARQLAMKLPEYSSMAAKMAEDCCDIVDDGLNLDEGTSYRIVSGQIDNAKGIVNDKLIPAVMNGSWSFISSCAAFLTAFAFMIMAAVFISRDMPKIKVQCDNSIFGTELKFLGGRLKDILTTYVKTQLIIMTLTCIICSAGLYFMGNPYALLLGVLIGIIDALPVLGTGTVFIPWCIILFVMGKYSSAVAILVIYLVAYYTREFLEPKLMGAGFGASPVLMLVSLYAGLILFGISGVITGPVAVILIREICTRLIKKLA